MRTAFVGMLVFLFALSGSGLAASGEDIPMARIGQLMSAVAGAPGAARDQIGDLLSSLLDEMLVYLEEQGVPESALEPLEERFAEALDAFLAEQSSGDEFGDDIADLARSLQERAEEDGIAGLPVELLERIGLNPEAVRNLQEENELTGLEIAALAQTIIGEFAPDALPAGPPDSVSPIADQNEGDGDDELGPPSGAPSGAPSGVPGDDDDDDNGGPPQGSP